MNAKKLQAQLIEMIVNAGETEEYPDLTDADVYTELEYGLMTNDRAIVLKLAAYNQVFQLTIQERQCST